MEAVVGLLLVLLGVSNGIETLCDGRQDDARCYGALGGSLILQLMDDASVIPRYQWKKDKATLLNGRKSNIGRNNLKEGSVFTPSNGTVKINNLNRNDSGFYTLALFDESFRKSGERNLSLSIQAPVTSVQLTSECLSQGAKRISCSSEGADSPGYSWTLNGRTLMDDELLYGTNETNRVALKVQVSGTLACNVHNEISNSSNGIQLPTCGFIFINCNSSNGTEISQWVYEATNTLCVNPTTVSTSSVGKETVTGSVKPSNYSTSFNQTVTASNDEHWYSILAGVLGALVVLIIVATAIAYTQKRKRHNKNKEEEDDQELTYADVKIIQRRPRQVEQWSDAGVEYGQVKFSEQPQQTEAGNEDCVYSQVRRAR